jgi:Retrotransposon gag protein
VGNLATEVTTLTAQVATIAATPRTGGGKKETVARPKPWDGKTGSGEARHFLAAFNNWAFSMDDALNDWNPTINNWTRNPGKWIQAVMNLMEGDARTWALPHLETLKNGTIPFTSSWTEFEREFTKRFIPLDVSESAREALKKLKQGKDSVAEYISKFDQYTTQTGWSDADHRQRFYDGLNDKIKDVLAYTDQTITTLTQLKDASSKIDRRIRQREAEKRGSNSSSSQSGTTSSNPDAMQVDATRQQPQSGGKPGQKTKAEYMKWMQGKCFGCGSKDHAKKDGKHERDVCNHCGKTGHRSNVCFTKYLGKPGKTAGAAATSESTDSTPSSSTDTAAATKQSPAKDSKNQADLLAQLMEKVKAQEAQINALKASF